MIITNVKSQQVEICSVLTCLFVHDCCQRR